MTAQVMIVQVVSVVAVLAPELVQPGERERPCRRCGSCTSAAWRAVGRPATRTSRQPGSGSAASRRRGGTPFVLATLSARALNIRPCVLRSFAHDGMSPQVATRSWRVGVFAAVPFSSRSGRLTTMRDGIGGRDVVVGPCGPRIAGRVDGVELLRQVLVRLHRHVAPAHDVDGTGPPWGRLGVMSAPERFGG